jgi:hypothetical protein
LAADDNCTRAADLLQQGQSAIHRLHRLQQENSRFREPERTILCDLLANGTLLPDPDGKRYGVQPVAEALAARPLLEQVARMGDRIGQHTVAEIMVISDRAAAWLRENPPGQPVAVEPRGCPMPGACACVEPAPPTEGEVAELVEWLHDCANVRMDEGYERPAFKFARAADLLQHLQPPQSVPVSERLQQMEDLAGDAVSALRYIEAVHGRLYGVGWNRVYEKADRLQPSQAMPIPPSENV